MNKKLVSGILSLALAVSVGSFSVASAEESTGGLLQDLVITGGITMILQNAQNANAGYLKNSKTPTVASYSIDLKVEKNFTENDKAFLHLETGQGDLNKQLFIISGVNRDADDSGAGVSVTEAWFRHAFEGTNFAVTIGKIDSTTGIDNNAYANDETTQFLGSAFRNSAAISLPGNSFGAQATYETDFVDLTAQYMEAKYENEMLNKEADDDFTRDTFISVQANFKPGFIENLEGNYRVFAWRNNSEYMKLDNGDISDNYGFGLSIDQQLTDKLGVFGRYAWQNPDVARLESIVSDDVSSLAQQSWSLGAELGVSLLSDADKVALAIGQNVISDKFSDSVGVDFKTENHFELYYSWQATDFLAITPDFQIIQNPAGLDDDDIYVTSIRAQISF